MIDKEEQSFSAAGSERTKPRTLRTALIALFLLILFAAFVTFVIVRARANTTPEQAVERFYRQWLELSRESTSTPLAKGFHQNSTYVTAGFGRTVAREAGRGGDAVFCGATNPTTFIVEPARYSRDGETASVRVTLDSVDIHVILLRDERAWWRIDEVDCPRVRSVPDVSENAEVAA